MSEPVVSYDADMVVAIHAAQLMNLLELGQKVVFPDPIHLDTWTYVEGNLRDSGKAWKIQRKLIGKWCSRVAVIVSATRYR
jgi:hypothetical protein